MIAYFDLCCWSKTLKDKLQAQSTSAEQVHCKTVFAELALLLKTTRWLPLDSVWKGHCFNLLSYLIFYIPNNVRIMVIISTYGIQSLSLEPDITSLGPDITPESTKSKKYLKSSLALHRFGLQMNMNQYQYICQ